MGLKHRKRNAYLNNTEGPFLVYQVSKNPRVKTYNIDEALEKWTFSNVPVRNPKWHSPCGEKFDNI